MIRQQLLYKNTAHWIHDHEIQEMTFNRKKASRHFSFAPPLAEHKGSIFLTDQSILLESDQEKLSIFLADVGQLYLGFDNLYTPASTKNFGLFWKPIKIDYGLNNNVVYLIVGYNYFYTDNDNFIHLLSDLLS